jgi:diguanylate cyclase (GGDEF)-like protein
MLVVLALMLLAPRWLALDLLAGGLAPVWLLVPLVLAATAAAIHRPWGGAGLGLGAAALGLVQMDFGTAVAAWLGLTAALAGEFLRRRAAAGLPEAPQERRGLVRALAEAATVAFAVLAGGAIWVVLGGVPLRAETSYSAPAGLAGLAYVVALLAGELSLSLARGEGMALRLRQLALPLLVEGAAWQLGVVLALVAYRIDLAPAMVLLAAGTLLVLEAVRQARRHGLAERRVEDLERVSRASERRPPPDRPMAAIAEQVRGECRSVLPFEWFELELPDGSGGRIHWRGQREGTIVDNGWGAGNGPGSAPLALPGFHRRGSWEVLERALRVDGEALATLRLWCDPRLMQPSARRLLEDLLPQMAASIERAILDREAKLDALTGVAVRRVLEARLQAAFRQASEEGSALAVVMLDVDHFKRINDAHGHDTGDRALQAVARALDSRRRAQDLLCRYGGEEFTLLLQGVSGERALRVADEMRQAVANLVLEAPAGRVPLSLSAGVAAFPELHVKAATELLLLADTALYRAKAAGRNRCLLDLGGGHYRAGDGELLSPAETRVAPAPQLFA